MVKMGIVPNRYLVTRNYHRHGLISVNGDVRKPDSIVWKSARSPRCRIECGCRQAMRAESLLSLAASVAGEHRTNDALRSIVRGLAEQPGVALARIWLLAPGDICDSCFLSAKCAARTQCLHLAASAGNPRHSDGEDWAFLQGHFRRIPLKQGKVGHIGDSGESILVGDFAPESNWFMRPEWATREQIRSFAGHALVHRGKILGVLGI